MLFITLLSVAVAVAAVVLAWRVTRDAQRRSDARVAVLMAELVAAPSPAASARDDTQGAASDEKVLVSNLFSDQSGPAPARPVPLWALVLGIAVLLGGGLAAALALSSSSGAGRPAATAAAPAPLELLSLEHEQVPDAVVVSGAVRNPTGADERGGITAVVVFFDTQGRPLPHTGAPGRLPSLAPGAEAPFTVRALLPAGASRVRVSFRQSNGGVAPHVDLRRAGGTP
ncbi:MAG: hypothetical protein ACRD2X_24215 [Vicinamibacteraceae bacterium]